MGKKQGQGSIQEKKRPIRAQILLYQQSVAGYYPIKQVF